MRFRIDLRIFLFLILFYFTNQIETYVMVLIFGFIHELGHIFAGVCLGMKPASIELMPLGLSVSFKLKPQDYNKKIKKANILEVKKIIVAIAGPITNIIIIIIASQLKLEIFTYLIILLSNMVIILFNLIPIYPMDGGRVLKGILHIFLGKKKSIKYTHNISFIVIILLTIISSLGILYLQNIAIFLAIIYLWYMFLVENKRYRINKKIYKIIEENKANNY